MSLTVCPEHRETHWTDDPRRCTVCGWKERVEQMTATLTNCQTEGTG
jgi:hypothetical protein